ncbi:MAG: hypothetical protein ACI4WM_00550 [Erysipelotrichaceae bacterium]
MEKQLKQLNKTTKHLRPFDEPLFYKIGKHRPEIMEDFLRLVLNDEALEFKSSSCREITPDRYGYDSLLAQFSAVTGNDRLIGLLTDEGTEPDVMANACLYYVLKKEEYMSDTMDYSLLPKMTIVVLMEKDVYKGNSPLYQLTWREDKTDWEFDGIKYIFVNGQYKGNDPLGDYIHDFMCDDVDDMRIDSIKEAVKFLEAYGDE